MKLNRTSIITKKKGIVYLLTGLILISLFGPLYLCVAKATELESPTKWKSIEDLGDAVVNLLFQISLVIAPLFIIIAGFYFVTAAGDPQKIETAKKIIIYTLIGLVIILASKGIIALVKSILGVSHKLK